MFQKIYYDSKWYLKKLLYILVEILKLILPAQKIRILTSGNAQLEIKYAHELFIIGFFVGSLTALVFTA